MRLYFKLSSTNEIVPFDYQYYLLGKFHKWLGANDYHDKLSLYSFGWLIGGEVKTSGISFKSGAMWFISFWDEDIGKKLIFNSMKNSDFIYGMKLLDIMIKDTPQFSRYERFSVSSPVLVRHYIENNKAKHILYDNPLSDELMTKTMQRKLCEVGLSNDISIHFDREYQNPKIKLIKINGIDNKVSFCPVIIEGNQESIKFAWNVGVGHSTGSGFGALI